MKKERSKGVSLRTADAISAGGLFGPGPATLKRLRWQMFEYTPKAGSTKKKVRAPALVAQFERDGEIESVPYSCGKGWAITDGGLTLSPRAGQTGLPDNSNAFYFLTSLEENGGMPKDFLDSPDQLDGVEMILVAKPIQRDFRDAKDKTLAAKGIVTKTILVCGEIISAPWMDEDEVKSKKKSKVKAKGKSDDEEEEDETEEEDSDDADADEESDDEESDDDSEEEEEENEKPVRRGGKSSGKIAAKPSKVKSKANGKADESDSDSDSDDSSDDEDTTDVDEEAAEALIEALSSKSPLKQAVVEKTIKLALKGNKQRNLIAARASEDDFLSTEAGWTYNEKKGTIALAE